MTDDQIRQLSVYIRDVLGKERKPTTFRGLIYEVIQPELEYFSAMQLGLMDINNALPDNNDIK